MRILAIESSVRQWSIALGNGPTIAAQFVADAGQPISRELLIAAQRLLASAGWTIDSVEVVAVNQGPGSFTGLRVGVTAAKILAYSLQCPLVGCDSLEVIAAATASTVEWQTGLTIRCVMDAQRSEMFTALFEITNDQSLVRKEPVRIVPASTLVECQLNGDLLTGPALTRWKPLKPMRLADESVWQPRAETIALWASRRFDAGFVSDPFKLRPEYYRPSYAEEK